MRTCNKCKIEKELTSDFYKKKSGYRTVCIKCMSDEKKEYRKTKEYRESYLEYKKSRIYKSRKEYFKKRRRNNILYKIRDNIGGSLRSCLREKFFSKKSRTYEILGCSYDEFKIHIESKFEPWMDWGNHGQYTGRYQETWHFDHIIPISSAKNEEEIIKLHHYTNYQPLDSKVNIVDKKDRLDF